MPDGGGRMMVWGWAGGSVDGTQRAHSIKSSVLFTIRKRFMDFI